MVIIIAVKNLSLIDVASQDQANTYSSTSPAQIVYQRLHHDHFPIFSILQKDIHKKKQNNFLI